VLTSTSHYGTATYYTQNNGYGSCGHKNPVCGLCKFSFNVFCLTHVLQQDSSKIVALSEYWWNGNGPGPYCGRKIAITNLGGGQQNNGKGNVVIATVADTCPGCTENHLDLSEGAFKALTGGHLDPPGTFNIVW
jgi:hypothetical protein